MKFENKFSQNKPKKNIYDKTKTAEQAVSKPRANVRLQKEEEKKEVKEVKNFELNPDSPFLNDTLERKAESDYEKKAKAAYDDVVKQNGIVYNASEEEQAEQKIERINFSLKKENTKNLSSSNEYAENNTKFETLKEALNLSKEAILEEKEEKERSIEDGINKLVQSNEENAEQKLAIVSDRTKKKEPVMIKFTAVRAVAMCFVLFISLGTFFGIGLMVGRDMQAKVNPIELPSIVPGTEESIVKKEEIILKAEELQYSDELKSSDRESLQNETLSAQASQDTQNSITPYPISDANTLANLAEKAKAEEIKKIEDSTIYDYVVRTATFKAENKANTFSKKLIANNLRGEVVRGANWYFVNVRFRGTPKNFEEMKEKLLKLGVDDSIILSKEALQLG